MRLVRVGGGFVEDDTGWDTPEDVATDGAATSKLQPGSLDHALLGEDIYTCDVPLGIGFHGLEWQRSCLGQFFVKYVHTSTWCAKQGVQEKDELLRIMDRPVGPMSRMGFDHEIKRRPMRLTMRAASGRAPHTAAARPVASRQSVEFSGHFHEAEITVLRACASWLARQFRSISSAFKSFDVHQTGCIMMRDFLEGCERVPRFQGDKQAVWDILDGQGLRQLGRHSFAALTPFFNEASRKRRAEEETAETGTDIYKFALPLLRPDEFRRQVKNTLRTLEFALSHGASPHSWHAPGNPLRSAVDAGAEDLVALLLQFRANPGAGVDERLVTPLHVATHHGHVAIVSLLLCAAADVNAADAYRQTPLAFAQCDEMCEELVAGSASLDAVNHRGQTALHLACLAGRQEPAMWLATKAVQGVIDTRDAHGYRAVDYARGTGLRAELVQLLSRGGHGPFPASSMEAVALSGVVNAISGDDEAPAVAPSFECVERKFKMMDYNDEERAIIRVQAARRGALGRKQASQKRQAAEQEAMKNEIAAALMIQKLHRGKLARRLIETKKAAIRAPQDELRAAIKIQQRRRGQLVRRNLKGSIQDNSLNELVEQLGSDPASVKAVTKVQAITRGQISRRIVPKHDIMAQDDLAGKKSSRGHIPLVATATKDADQPSLQPDALFGSLPSADEGQGGQELTRAALKVQSVRRGVVSRRKTAHDKDTEEAAQGSAGPRSASTNALPAEASTSTVSWYHTPDEFGHHTSQNL